MSNVVSLGTGQAANSKHAEELILDAAKEVEAGTVAAMIVVAVYLDGTSDFGVSVDASINPDTMIGALERAKREVMEMGDES
ncbi:MAG: hypothetical protein Q8L60_10720 [Gammaproteobacteria bacterium]|nr:hypothetical protein [Gammaproteobacteria bacterium]MDP2346821.1 hypothetical protein [Gammaproteobacteria bacterium]